MNEVSYKKYLVSRERIAMLAPIYWNALAQTSPETANCHGVQLGDVWIHFAPGNVYRGIHLKKNINAAGKQIARNIFENPQHLFQLNRVALQHKKSIELFSAQFSTTRLPNLSLKNLLTQAFMIKKLWLAYDQVTVLPWFMGAEYFRNILLDELDIPEEDFDLLATPEEKTIVSQLELMLLQYAKLIKQNVEYKNTLAAQLASQYGHVPFGYDGPDYWDDNAFMNRLEEKLMLPNKTLEKELLSIIQHEKLTRRRKIQKIKQHGLLPEHLAHFKSFHVLINWTDERKDLDFRLHYQYAQIMWELEKRFRIPYQNLKYLFTDELELLEQCPDKLYQESQQRMTGDFIFRYSLGKRTILTKKETAAFLTAIKKQEQLHAMLKGMVAAKGDKEKYTGIARIALTPQNAASIKPGEFLVTTMTTPDFISAMKHADGFITDEGGITCHAAIVAREMRKPCIIGTKNATKALRNGDHIEIDMATGIINKVS